MTLSSCLSYCLCTPFCNPSREQNNAAPIEQKGHKTIYQSVLPALRVSWSCNPTWPTQEVHCQWSGESCQLFCIGSTWNLGDSKDTIITYLAYRYCPEWWRLLWWAVIDSKHLYNEVHTSKNPVQIFHAGSSPAVALKEILLCLVWTLIKIEPKLFDNKRMKWLTVAITCSSNEPSFPPSLIFPVAKGSSQDESIIRSDPQWELTQGRNSQIEGNGGWSYGSRSLLKLLFPLTECGVVWRDIVLHCNYTYK